MTSLTTSSKWSQPHEEGLGIALQRSETRVEDTKPATRCLLSYRLFAKLSSCAVCVATAASAASANPTATVTKPGFPVNSPELARPDAAASGPELASERGRMIEQSGKVGSTKAQGAGKMARARVGFRLRSGKVTPSRVSPGR